MMEQSGLVERAELGAELLSTAGQLLVSSTAARTTHSRTAMPAILTPALDRNALQLDEEHEGRVDGSGALRSGLQARRDLFKHRVAHCKYVISNGL